MKQCGVFVENKEITIKDDMKSQLYLLTRFLEKSNSFIKELVDKYKKKSEHIHEYALGHT